MHERPDHPDWNLSAFVTDDGNWLIVNASQGTDPNNRVFVRDLQVPGSEIVPLLAEGDANYGYAGNIGGTFFFLTTKDAPRGRVARMSVVAPELIEVVAENADSLEGAMLFGDQLILAYLHDAHSVVRRVSSNGEPIGDLALPGLGTASGFGGKQTDAETFYAFTSYTTPASVYRLDLITGESSLVFAPKVPFDPNAFESEQVFYTSKDGTRIPMIITRKAGTPRDGNTPTILYGLRRIQHLAHAGVLTDDARVARTRRRVRRRQPARRRRIRRRVAPGRHERTQAKRVRRLHRRRRVPDRQGLHVDAEARDPRRQQRRVARRCLRLRSGRISSVRPSLLVGVMDMLRFQKFTIGWAWTSDYGSSDDPAAFEYLRAYSPLHNIKPGTAYPPTLIVTADHDDRVFPAHSFKFAAALQAAQGGDAPVLIRIETKAGHGAGKPTGKVIDEAADRFAFLVKVLGVPVKETPV